jgi:methionine aminopeptidase
LQKLTHIADYTLANPDTITKYKVAADISQKVLKEVSGTIYPKPVLASRA